MLNTIRSFFVDFIQTDNTDEKDNIQSQIQLATAALLIEVIKADSHTDEEEMNSLLNILNKKFHLPKETLNDLVSMADEEVREATSLYQFTRLINQNYDHEQKYHLMLSLWEIAFADNNLDKYEEYLIRKIAELIYISHSDFIQTKHQARDKQIAED